MESERDARDALAEIDEDFAEAMDCITGGVWPEKGDIEGRITEGGARRLDGYANSARDAYARLRALAATRAGEPVGVPTEVDIVAYIKRQWAWSKETFGPALRTGGVLDHIRKELREIEADPHDLSEWVDVIILAMDGFWRHGGQPEDLLPRMQAKQDKNFARQWPDWRSMSENSAIEHDRSGEIAPVTQPAIQASAASSSVRDNEDLAAARFLAAGAQDRLRFIAEALGLSGYPSTEEFLAAIRALKSTSPDPAAAARSGEVRRRRREQGVCEGGVPYSELGDECPECGAKPTEFCRGGREPPANPDRQEGA